MVGVRPRAKRQAAHRAAASSIPGGHAFFPLRSFLSHGAVALLDGSTKSHPKYAKEGQTRYGAGNHSSEASSSPSPHPCSISHSFTTVLGYGAGNQGSGASSSPSPHPCSTPHSFNTVLGYGTGNQGSEASSSPSLTPAPPHTVSILF